MRGHHQLADGVHQLTVQTGINAFVLVDDGEVTLVDAGLNGAGLVGRLAGLGIAPGDVTRVLLTHGHPDHVGGISRLEQAGASPEVKVGEGDIEVVRDGVSPGAVTPDTGAGRLFARLPKVGPMGRAGRYAQATVLRDGDELDIAGGLRVVATPGHSPGHVAFHLPAHDLVLGGDVLFNVFSLRPSPRFLCWRVPLNLASIGTLADIGAGTLALAHGSPVTDDVAGRLRQVAADHR